MFKKETFLSQYQESMEILSCSCGNNEEFISQHQVTVFNKIDKHGDFIKTVDIETIDSMLHILCGVCNEVVKEFN